MITEANAISQNERFPCPSSNNLRNFMNLYFIRVKFLKWLEKSVRESKFVCETALSFITLSPGWLVNFSRFIRVLLCKPRSYCWYQGTTVDSTLVSTVVPWYSALVQLWKFWIINELSTLYYSFVYDWPACVQLLLRGKML